MRIQLGRVARVAAGLALLVLSVEALRAEGWIRWVAGTEIVAAAAFCLPGVWRIGGIALLGILGVVFTHHALAGHFAASLLFAALAVLMALVYERA